jgi:negative regulator of sigma E activity
MATSCGFESHRPHQIKGRLAPREQGDAMRASRLRETSLRSWAKQVSPPIAHAALVYTPVEMIKQIGPKDTLQEAAGELVQTLQRAISKSAN